MLRNVEDLRGYALRATDGVIGDVDDLYFDDEDWAIRYLVVDTGNWLSGRKVLISPVAIGHPDWLGQLLPVSLTKAQVEGSPDIDTRKPVSRQQEAVYFRHYGYPYYWGGGGLWGMGAYPGSLTAEDRIQEAMETMRTAATQTPDETHLRSCRAVIGNHVHATDGDLGHVEDFLVDEHTWAIRYLIVDTSNWWGGHQVLIAPAVDRGGELVRGDRPRRTDSPGHYRCSSVRLRGATRPSAGAEHLRASRPSRLLDHEEDSRRRSAAREVERGNPRLPPTSRRAAGASLPWRTVFIRASRTTGCSTVNKGRTPRHAGLALCNSRQPGK